MVEQKSGMQTDRPKIQTFKDLTTWQEGHKLVLMIYRITVKLPKLESYGLADQMRRAAVSITSNIAEGFSRTSYKEKTQFYSIAQGSVTEIQNQLLIARDVAYIVDTDFTPAESQAIVVHKLLNGLLKRTKELSRLRIKNNE